MVVHSQSVSIPDCPLNLTRLWTGYSLLYVQGHDTSHGQDLGASGSCLRRFTTMPYLFCNINEQCYYASRNDYSYWLTTDLQIPMMPISAPAVEPFISRCAVCEAPGPVVATHSQSTNIPDCPAGWQPIWNGYSFLMVMFYLMPTLSPEISKNDFPAELYLLSVKTIHGYQFLYSDWLRTFQLTPNQCNLSVQKSEIECETVKLIHHLLKTNPCEYLKECRCTLCC